MVHHSSPGSALACHQAHALEAHSEIDPELLAAVGLVKKADDPIVILGGGNVSVALNVKAHRFSKSARQKIEAAGGIASVIPLK